MESLNRSLEGFNSILLPHRRKKILMAQLFQLISEMRSDSIIKSSPGLVRKFRTLFLDKLKSSGRKYTIRTNLIVHKFKLLQQFRYEYILNNPVKAEYFKPIHDIKLFRDLFRLYMTFVVISKPDLKNLQRIRYFENFWLFLSV